MKNKLTVDEAPYTKYTDEDHGEFDPMKPVLDREKYRGRGRPRRKDYSSLFEIQSRINDQMRKNIETFFKRH